MDDMFFGNDVDESVYFTEKGGQKLFVETHLKVKSKIEFQSNSEWKSLQYTNGLLNTYFRDNDAKFRYYTSHGPHMSDRFVWNEIEKIWLQETTETSSHRFRGMDIHRHFMYIFYLQERVSKPFDLKTMFEDILDEDRNGMLSECELIQLEDWSQCNECVNQEMDKMTLQDLEQQTSLIDGLKKSYDETEKERKESTLSIDNPLQFMMLQENNYATELKRLLQTKSRYKMFCLNDDFRDTTHARVVTALREAYEVFFPQKSKFEK